MTVRTPRQGKATGGTKGSSGSTAVSPQHDPAGALNEVRLVGRVSADPIARTLPSGDRLVTFRLIVDRPAGGRSTQTIDALECSAWAARVQRSVLRWQPGDVVEVSGAIRRRFFRGAGGAASRVEVEVSSAKLRRRRRDA